MNGHDSGTGRRSRTESLSSHRSQSSSNTFDLLSTEDTMLADFHSDSEYSYFSQDGFDELSQDSAGRSTSSLSLNVDMDGLGPKAEAQTTPVEPDQSDNGWTVVGRRKKPQRIVSEEFNRENRGRLKFMSKGILLFVIILNLQRTMKNSLSRVRCVVRVPSTLH